MKSQMFSAFRAMSQTLGGRGIGKIPGIVPVYDFLYSRLKPSGLTIVESDGHRILVDPRDNAIARQFLLRSAYEQEEKEIFKRILDPGMVVVDVGANIGDYTLLAARAVGASGLVYSFEPEPHNFSLLAQNVKANGYANVRCYNKALAGEPGRLTLHVDPSNHGGSSLIASNVPDTADSVVVETDTLDNVLSANPLPRPVGLIKMDAQGAEGGIMQGASGTLATPGICLIIEFWPFGLRNFGSDPMAFLDLFRARGFEIRMIDGSGLRDCSTGEIFAECGRRDEGRGSLDLLFAGAGRLAAIEARLQRG